METADRYSRAVLWLKVALPLVALGILSTLFFVAETLDPDAAIPYADVDVAKIVRDQGVTGPAFGGVTSSGVSISIFADAVRPSSERAERLTAQRLRADLKLPNGAHLTIESPTGIVDGGSEEAILNGGARLESSTGYLVATEEILTSLGNTTVVAPNEVVATGPPGQITAGRMELLRTEVPDPSYFLVFQDGVRLVYKPIQKEDQ